MAMIVIRFSIYLFIWKIYVKCPCNGGCNKVLASIQSGLEGRQAHNYTEQNTKEEERQERDDYQTFNEMNFYSVFF